MRLFGQSSVTVYRVYNPPRVRESGKILAPEKELMRVRSSRDFRRVSSGNSKVLIQTVSQERFDKMFLSIDQTNGALSQKGYEVTELDFNSVERNRYKKQTSKNGLKESSHSSFKLLEAKPLKLPKFSFFNRMSNLLSRLFGCSKPKAVWGI